MPYPIKGFQWRRKKHYGYVLVRVPTHAEPEWRRKRLKPSKVRIMYRKKTKA